MAPQALRCPHCNAPLTRIDGKDPLECNYCHSALTAEKPAFVMPTAEQMGPRNGGLITVLVIGTIVLVLGGVGAAAWLSGSTTSTQPTVVVTAPAPLPPAPKPVEPPKPPSPVKEVLSFGEAGTNPGQFDSANHLTVTPDGSIFVAEGSSGRVQKFDATGKYVDVIQVPDDKLTVKHSIFGLAADAKGHVYVNRVGDILVYDGATLKLTRSILGSYPDLYYHHGLCADATGEVLALTDRTGDVSLVRVSAAGKVTGHQRADAVDVAVDGTGHVFLVGDDGLEVRDAKGAVQTKVGGLRGSSVAFDGKGHVFVATGSDVQVISAAGEKVVSLPVNTSEISLDATGRLVALVSQSVKVFEVTLP